LPRSEGSSSVAHPQAWADASQGLGDRQGDSSRNEIGSKASLSLNERVFIDGRRALVHHAPQLNPSLAPRDEIKGRRERSLHPDGARTAYPATKHAQIGFFDSLRVELEGSGVSVTVVCPYFVRSEIRKRSAGPDGRTLAVSPVHEETVMSAEECARRMVRAMERRQRMLVMTLKGKLGRFLKLVAPGLVDRMVARTVAKGR